MLQTVIPTFFVRSVHKLTWIILNTILIYHNLLLIKFWALSIAFCDKNFSTGCVQNYTRKIQAVSSLETERDQEKAWTFLAFSLKWNSSFYFMVVMFTIKDCNLCFVCMKLLFLCISVLSVAKHFMYYLIHHNDCNYD